MFRVEEQGCKRSNRGGTRSGRRLHASLPGDHRVRAPVQTVRYANGPKVPPNRKIPANRFHHAALVAEEPAARSAVDRSRRATRRLQSRSAAIQQTRPVLLALATFDGTSLKLRRLAKTAAALGKPTRAAKRPRRTGRKPIPPERSRCLQRSGPSPNRVRRWLGDQRRWLLFRALLSPSKPASHR